MWWKRTATRHPSIEGLKKHNGGPRIPVPPGLESNTKTENNKYREMGLGGLSGGKKKKKKNHSAIVHWNEEREEKRKQVARINGHPAGV